MPMAAVTPTSESWRVRFSISLVVSEAPFASFACSLVRLDNRPPKADVAAWYCSSLKAPAL